MFPLVDLFAVSSSFVVGSMLAMALLLLMRIMREADEAEDLRARATTRAALLEAMRGSPDLADRLAALKDHPSLVAETLLELAALVRGPDRHQMLVSLLEGGVLPILIAGVDKRSSRLLCVEAIGLFPKASVEPILRKLLVDPQPEARLAAAVGLQAIGADLSVAAALDLVPTSGAHPGLVNDLVRSIVRSKPLAGREILAQEDLSPSTKALLIDALGRASDFAASPIVMRHADDGDPAVRAAVVLCLGRLMHPDGQDVIARAFGDPDWGVRAAAARAVGLGSFGGLIAPLTERLSDPVWTVRRQAADALKTFGEDGARQLRQVADESQDAVVSELARCALSGAGGT